MPKVRVYLPDDLHRAARDHDLSISAVAQAALAAEVDRLENRAWLTAARRRPRRVKASVDTRAAVDAARKEFAG